jgi:hypothetical protein
MKITVLNRKPEEIETTWEGVTRKRVQQWAVIEIDGLPTSFQITNDPGKDLPPGEYTLGAKSFNVQNGRLTIQRVVLDPVAPKSAAAKA